MRSSFRDVVDDLYYNQIYSAVDAYVEESPGRLECYIIMGLLGPFSYVIQKYSVLYYYENDCFPSNLDIWIKTIDNISKNRRFAERLMHGIRLESELPLHDRFIACKKVINNINCYAEAINFDKEFALTHAKEEYLSI